MQIDTVIMDGSSGTVANFMKKARILYRLDGKILAIKWSPVYNSEDQMTMSGHVKYQSGNTALSNVLWMKTAVDHLGLQL